jgi:hypothetical protein
MNNTTKILALALMMVGAADARKLTPEQATAGRRVYGGKLPLKQATATGMAGSKLGQTIEGYQKEHQEVPVDPDALVRGGEEEKQEPKKEKQEPEKEKQEPEKEKTLEERRKAVLSGTKTNLLLDDFLGAPIDTEKGPLKNAKKLSDDSDVSTLSDLRDDLDKIKERADVMNRFVNNNPLQDVLKNSEKKRAMFDANGSFVDALKGLNHTTVGAVGAAGGAGNAGKVKLSNEGDFLPVEEALKKLEPLGEVLFKIADSGLMKKEDADRFKGIYNQAQNISTGLDSDVNKANKIKKYAGAMHRFMSQTTEKKAFGANANISEIKKGKGEIQEIKLSQLIQELAKGNTVYTKEHANQLKKIQQKRENWFNAGKEQVLKDKDVDPELKKLVGGLDNEDENLGAYMSGLVKENFQLDTSAIGKAFGKAAAAAAKDDVLEKGLDGEGGARAVFDKTFQEGLKKEMQPAMYLLNQFLEYKKHTKDYTGLGNKGLSERRTLAKKYKVDRNRDNFWLLPAAQ